MKRSLLTALSAVILTTTSCSVPERPQLPPLTTENFLEHFRAADRAALSSMSLSGHVSLRAGPIADDDGRAVYDVVFSSDGRKEAWWLRLDGEPSRIEYVPRGEGPQPFSAPSYFEGKMHFWVQEEHAFLRDAERSESLAASRTYWVDPDGRLGKAERVWGMHDEEAHDPLRRHWLERVLWAGGRGISEQIEEVTEVVHKESGLVRVRATGTYPNTGGHWQLTVDPAQGLLVREAVYTAGRTVVRLTTTGIVGRFPITIACDGELTIGDRRLPAVTVHFDEASGHSRKRHDSIEDAVQRLANLPFRIVRANGKTYQYQDGQLRTTP